MKEEMAVRVSLPPVGKESAFELVNNLEAIFTGAFLQKGELAHPALAEDKNYVSIKVKSKHELPSANICFRREVLNLPIIKTALGLRPGPGRPRLKPLVNGHVTNFNTVKPKKPRITTNWLDCHKCDYKCRKRRPLQRHLLDEHNEMIYLCEYCEDIYKTKDEMKAHERNVHGGIRYPCPEVNCTFFTSVIAELEDHFKMHDVDEFPCELCPHKLKSKQELNMHMEQDHEGVRFYCEECDFINDSREVIRNHQLEFHSQPCRCSKCDFCTINMKLLRGHEATFHSAVEYKCNKCDFKSSWESCLKEHYEEHHGQREWQCELCDFNCKWKAGFSKHMKDKHSEAGMLETQCNFCGLQFACKRDLKRHVKETHERPQEFNCSYCGKNFPKKPNLKIHERIHTGEKPYKCELCGHAFTAASNLYHHKKKHMKDAANPKPIKIEKHNGGEGSSLNATYDPGYLPQPSGSQNVNYRNDSSDAHAHSHPMMDNMPGSHMPDPHHMVNKQEHGVMPDPITKTEPGGYPDQQYFPQYYGGGGGGGNGPYPPQGSSNGGGKMHGGGMYDGYNSSPGHSMESGHGSGGPPPDQHYRRQNSGDNHPPNNQASGDYRRIFTEEQYRMIAQEEEYRKKSLEEQYRKFSSSGASIEEQYRKFATEEHYRKLATEEQYRMLASAAAGKIDRGGLWMPALH